MWKIAKLKTIVENMSNYVVSCKKKNMLKTDLNGVKKFKICYLNCFYCYNIFKYEVKNIYRK